MKKYTFIADFRSGTYISQYIRENVYSAFEAWSVSLDISIYPQQIIKRLQKEII